MQSFCPCMIIGQHSSWAQNVRKYNIFLWMYPTLSQSPHLCATFYKLSLEPFLPVPQGTNLIIYLHNRNPFSDLFLLHSSCSFSFVLGMTSIALSSSGIITKITPCIKVKNNNDYRYICLVSRGNVVRYDRKKVLIPGCPRLYLA
jgi:hypothetical protein